MPNCSETKLMNHLPPEPAEGSSWRVRCQPWQGVPAPPPSTPSAASRRGRWGTPGLLENQGGWPALAKGGGPPEPVEGPLLCGSRPRACAVPEAVHLWARSQMACHLLSLSKGPLPGRGCQNKPPPQVLDSHLPLFEKPVYLPHPHHQPLAISEASYLGSFTNLPHASAHFTLALV